MLSRTADHLYWMARYMERAENTARMLDVNYQTSLLPQSDDAALSGWRGLLSISELTGDYAQRYGDVTAQDVMNFMVQDPANPGKSKQSGFWFSFPYYRPALMFSPLASRMVITWIM